MTTDARFVHTAPVIGEATPVTLTQTQEDIVDTILMRIRTRDPECVLGKAGVGKTVVLKHLYARLNVLFPTAGEVVLLSPTGIAAVNIGGGAQTIHSFAFGGLAEGSVTSIVNEYSRKPEIAGRWMRAKILLVDEVSMVSGLLIEKMSRLAQRIRSNNDVPFGGIKVVFFGDFYQLPPVNSEKDGWAFNSQHWIQMFHAKGNTGNIYVMDEVQRQRGKDADVFIRHLHHVREGRCPRETAEFFSTCARSLDIGNGIKPTILFCTNADVDAINRRELENLTTTPMTFTASDDGPGANAELVSKKLDETTTLSRNLVLKIGAQVVLLRNMDVTRGFVNGSRGVVTRLDPTGFPAVMFESGEITISPCRVEVKGRRDNDPVYTRIQLPLKLAWAMTIHKCQGMSLDKVQINLSKTFVSGQAYVALSRARSASGLQIINGFHPSMIKLHRDIVKYNAAVMRKIETQRAKNTSDHPEVSETRKRSADDTDDGVGGECEHQGQSGRNVKSRIADVGDE